MQNKNLNFQQTRPLRRGFQGFFSSAIPLVLLAAKVAYGDLLSVVQAAPQIQPPAGSSGQSKGAGAKPDPNNELMNEGDEVVPNAKSSPRGGANTSKTVVHPDAAKNPATNPGSSTASAQQKPEWSVLLMTFTEQGHAQAAQATLHAIAMRYPNLASARVRSLEKGSAIVFGTFAGLEDANAKPVLAMVKSIEENGVKPFARAHLVRLQTTANQFKQGPYDLSKARARFANVNPLFTIKVATWSDFQSGEIPFEESQRKAEAYCAELRLQGIEAYVKHDADDQSSTVTIGVFDSSAYDARSTLFHPEVEKIMRKFPVLLVNGEPLYMPPPKGLSNAKPEATRSSLIEVPR